MGKEIKKAILIIVCFAFGVGAISAVVGRFSGYDIPAWLLGGVCGGGAVLLVNKYTNLFKRH